ncbi:MAG: hypothetical protein QXG39_00920 [Candidatus Aenigmatarchaeota archaeon]
MFFTEKKNKGLVITLNLILGALFAVGLIALIYWIFISRILEVHVAIEENTLERRAINLANLLISSEKIAYEKDGKIMRGILDSEKLENIFSREYIFLSQELKTKNIGIGYPNSIILVRVLDLEECDSSGNCKGWATLLSGPISLEGTSINKFLKCLSEHVKLDVGSIFRWAVGGIVLGLWQPWDVKNCVQNTMPANVKAIFTTSKISSQGLPVMIKYPNGELHLGRISVAIGEFL